ncbi:DUF397 domain-containing protein [Streptomyces albidoflavus]|uniref:DUF397 domain-containing protein n=1 Tax=Streptomyces albidoflavus TaxID=1886 RepID=A0A8G1ZZA9_9ACTN|nr:DUF397 domain-containing protein [Streptomyces albidoflavus]MYX49737.1 DUF397 domain-containing protein [Streptomyces sp. SID8385]RZE26228.1 DUF397 domain-containing protein [Streptomyces albidoflavus]WSU15097.1 DUF397 domain-containing protein [Streptomyces albidoflavus]
MKTDELAWFKSSYSSGDGDSCVEVANCSSAVLVRDSKLSDSPQLSLSPAAWADFVNHAPRG